MQTEHFESDMRQFFYENLSSVKESAATISGLWQYFTIATLHALSRAQKAKGPA
jgi:hypothetical protein